MTGVRWYLLVGSHALQTSAQALRAGLESCRYSRRTRKISGFTNNRDCEMTRQAPMQSTSRGKVFGQCIDEINSIQIHPRPWRNLQHPSVLQTLPKAPQANM